MPRYDWDEDKRIKNVKNHRLDFRAAKRVYEHPNKVTVEDIYPYEERHRDLAEIDGKVALLVYTMRDDTVRCISFRFATRKERGLYYEQIANR